MTERLTKDEVAIEKVSREITKKARELLAVTDINWYNTRVARGSVLRILRAAIELTPTEGDI